MALGALIAPPDPVAATAVAGQLGLPRRLVSILEGEGLFNDVTAIVLYHVAIAAVVSGEFSVWQAGLELVLSAVVAVAVGGSLADWSLPPAMSQRSGQKTSGAEKLRGSRCMECGWQQNEVPGGIWLRET